MQLHVSKITPEKKLREMELTQHGFLEELLAPRRDSWTTFASGVSDFFPTQWNFDNFDENPSLATSNPSLVDFSAPTEPSFECPFNFGQAYRSFVDGFTVPEIESSYTKNATSPFQIQEDYPAMVEAEDLGLLINDNHHSFEDTNNSSKAEGEATSNNVKVFNTGLCGDKKSKSKKLDGQPSKNLMAERRRRKRLNDRLSMLRSIVPKISKMDRTSILGDTIDYMKELLERINILQEEETETGTKHVSLMENLKELKPNQVLVRNSPKFDVARGEIDTRIDICCAAKPGLLLSTVNTLEALGLEIQQCAISCFNDFAMQASCSEVSEQRTLITSEDIKQALFRTAGYGGR
ncbi:HLH domain-containing protein [Cephalotus follicularis]|uniref:HLH domain-containing protein n=1 Tax=Cephalotus follicularis TaxID=3775 RepID=A0A1Q3BA06_CEPFO|nr:HLH domain-containing protein [Cephalotus follicularis]